MPCLTCKYASPMRYEGKHTGYWHCKFQPAWRAWVECNIGRYEPQV